MNTGKIFDVKGVALLEELTPPGESKRLVLRDLSDKEIEEMNAYLNAEEAREWEAIQD